MNTNLALGKLLFSAGLIAFAWPARAEDPPKPDSPPALELAIYAPLSAQQALEAMQSLYAKEKNVKLVLTFGSSNDMVRQIAGAKAADVFLSADALEMDRVEGAKILVQGSRRDLLSNQLVVIEPLDATDPERSAFTQPFDAKQLAGPNMKALSMANPESVAAGRYARDWLEKRGAWELVKDRVVPANDMRAAVAALESGAAQAAIVYRSELPHAQKSRVVHMVPVDEAPKIVYPIAAIDGRANTAPARELIEFLGGEKARKTWEDAGFIVLTPRVPDIGPEKKGSDKK